MSAGVVELKVVSGGSELMSSDEEIEALLACREKLYDVAERSNLPKHLRHCFESNADLIGNCLDKRYGVRVKERR